MAKKFAGLVAALRAALGQALHHARLPRVHPVAAHEAVEIVEAALGRRFTVAHMPFSGGSRAIAGGLEHLRDGHAVRVQRPAITGERLTFVAGTGILCGLVGSHQPDARLMRIKPR